MSNHFKNRLKNSALQAVVFAILFSACASSKPIEEPEKEFQPDVEKTTIGYHADLREFAYPFDLFQFVVQSKGKTLQMTYMDLRPEEKQKGVFILLHGKNFNASYFRALAIFLYRQGYRVIMPDQIGFGKSSKPEGYQFTFQEMARTTKALLDHLEVKRAYVFGHSMGGMLGIRFGLMYPDAVTRLFLVNPLGLEDWKTVVPYRTVDELRADEERNTPEKLREYQQKNYYGGKWSPLYEEWIQAPIGVLNGQDFLSVATISALTTEMIFTQPVYYELENLRVPTTFLIGTRDRTAIGKSWADPKIAEKLGDYKKLGRAAARRVKGARLIELDDLGHVPFIENFPKFWNVFARQL